MSKEQLKRSVKGNIKLKTYNGMHIMQLGMCAVHIKLKNIKKRYVFLVAPGNGQALLGMPDTVVLNIINLNIDSIQAVNIVNKQNTNGQNDPSDQHMSINYFCSSNNVDADKRSSIAMMQSIHTRFGNIFQWHRVLQRHILIAAQTR